MENVFNDETEIIKSENSFIFTFLKNYLTIICKGNEICMIQWSVIIGYSKIKSMITILRIWYLLEIWNFWSAFSQVKLKTYY